MSVINSFKDSIENGHMPSGLSLPLQALWYDGAGDWQRGHDLIDQLGDRASAHVHAYFHRKEGDLWNADYWYRRAGQKRPDASLDEEWGQLVELYYL